MRWWTSRASRRGRASDPWEGGLEVTLTPPKMVPVSPTRFTAEPQSVPDHEWGAPMPELVIDFAWLAERPEGDSRY